MRTAPPDDEVQVDRLIDGYIDWREDAAAVRDAYARWSVAPAAERAIAFATYRASLDFEELACRRYAELVDRVTLRVSMPRESR